MESDSSAPIRHPENARTPKGRRSMREVNNGGILEIEVTRAQAWDIYTLLAAKAEMIETAEHACQGNLGSKRYREAAWEIQWALDGKPPVQTLSGRATSRERNGEPS